MKQYLSVIVRSVDWVVDQIAVKHSNSLSRRLNETRAGLRWQIVHGGGNHLVIRTAGDSSEGQQSTKCGKGELSPWK